MQSKRMDEQRVVLPFLPGLNANSANQPIMQSSQDADDSFIEMLVCCQVIVIFIAKIFKIFYNNYVSFNNTF